MSWPLSHDFNEAVQNPRAAFADPDLRAAEPVVGATGLPLPRSGNFADVYQMRGADGRDWAVKCFTRPVVGLADRYARVSDALARAGLPFTVGFTFLADGIRVGGVRRPVVKMEWVEGLLLNQVVRENAGRPAVLASLGRMWARLCERLRNAGVAHADLQYGNVLLVPGARPGVYDLKLIDYDGMFVPALANTPSGETGHPSFQHPARAATNAYSPDVDRFPHLVVATALAALEEGGPALWGRYDNGDNLLFTDADFRAPAESPLVRELWALRGPKVRALVGRLAVACGRPIPQTPWLDEIAPDGEPVPLDAGTRAAAAMLGLGSGRAVSVSVTSAVRVEQESPAPKTAKKPGTRDKPVRATTRAPKHSRKSAADQRRPKARFKFVGWPLFVIAVLAACAVVGGALALRPKPPATVQQVGDDGGAKPSEAVTPKPSIPTPKPKDLVAPPKPKDKEPHPVAPPKPKDPLPPPEPAVLKATWSVPADSGGVPAVVYADAQNALVGSPRAPLLTFDLVNGTKRPAFNWLPLAVGDHFCPLALGKVAWCPPDETEVRTWDAATAKPVAKFPVPAIAPGADGANNVLLRLSPDTRHMVVARGSLAPGDYAETPFHVLATDKSGTPVVSARWAGGSVHFTADSARVLVAEYGGRFRWFDLATGRAESEWTYGAPGEGRAHRVTAVSADGAVIGYTGPAKSATETGPCLVDGKTGEVMHRFGRGCAAGSPVALAANGRLAAVLKEPDGDEAMVEVVSVPKGEVIARATLTTNRAAPTFALSPDGRTLLVHDPKGGTLRRFDRP